MKKVALVLGGHNATLVSHAWALMAWGGCAATLLEYDEVAHLSCHRRLER